MWINWQINFFFVKYIFLIVRKYVNNILIKHLFYVAYLELLESTWFILIKVTSTCTKIILLIKSTNSDKLQKSYASLGKK